MTGDPEPAVDRELDERIGRADLDGLVRLVDALCATQDWERLDRLRLAARAAISTGRQLWPAATLASYRLALYAPPGWAVRALDNAVGRFAPGPLAEVLAQNHPFTDLAALLPQGPDAAFVAQERVVRGEVIDGQDLMDVLEIPYVLAPWEPAYPLAEYTDEGGRFPSPEPPAVGRPVAGRRGETITDPDVDAAARSLVEPWTTQSNGRLSVACADGGVADALGAVGISSARVVELAPGDAIAWLAWAGASGGAHGGRRGAATGRFGAWWLLAALGGLLDEWPVPAAHLGTLAEELRWFWWDIGEPMHGWTLQIAVEDPVELCAWAISAHDAM